MTQPAAENSQTADYGLRREILSPMETLAQSVSTMAPTTIFTVAESVWAP